MKKYLILATALMIISGCQKKIAEDSIAKKETPVSQVLGVNDLVNEMNIGNQLSFVEKQFSLSPKSKTDKGAVYEYEGCEVELTVDKQGNVESIAAYVVSPKCSFETGFGNSKNITIEKLISRDKQSNYQSRILVNCVSSCGHTREPEYIYLSPGASVNGYIATALISKSVDGTDVWLEKVKLILKLDNLDGDELINCTDKFDKLAMEHLKGGAISSVVISAPDSIYWNDYPTGCKK